MVVHLCAFEDVDQSQLVEYDRMGLVVVSDMDQLVVDMAMVDILLVMVVQQLLRGQVLMHSVLLNVLYHREFQAFRAKSIIH